MKDPYLYLEMAMRDRDIMADGTTELELATIRVIENVIYIIEDLENSTISPEISASAKRILSAGGYKNNIFISIIINIIKSVAVYVDIEECSVGDESLLELANSIWLSTLSNNVNIFNIYINPGLSMVHCQDLVRRLTVYIALEENGLEAVRANVKKFAIKKADELNEKATARLLL